MNKGLFITGTGTDIGKTYVTALLVKLLREKGINCGYYKSALSGADSIAESDAGYVNKIANINQDENSLISYLYKNAVSPHLASQIEGNPVEIEKVKADYQAVCEKYSKVIVEGSGGIVCPIRYDEKEKIMLEDIIKALDLPVLIVTDAGLGTINSTILTIEYLQKRNFLIKGIILNNYNGNKMQKDNIKMIEELSNIKIIATVEKNATEINIDEIFFENIVGDGFHVPLA